MNSLSPLPILWLVTDQLPYPPRNGITLPIFNYLVALKTHYTVQLILLVNESSPPSDMELAKNAELFGEVLLHPLQRRTAVERLFGEVTCREMYQHGWSTSDPQQLFNNQMPTVVLVSPMSAVAKWGVCRHGDLPTDTRHFAAVNDCTTAEYYYRGQTQVNNLRQKIKGLVDRIRSPFIGRIEAKLLKPYKAVFLQTCRDQQLMRQLVDKAVAAKVVLTPNGVDPAYLQIKAGSGCRLVFVAELSGEYEAVATWLATNVWPTVADLCPGATLLIVGKGATPELKAAFRSVGGVEHIEYVADLASVYASAMVAISPVFKGFGLINKTLEAMASGLPVVGGLAAFNGIDGFVPGVHGVTCAKRTTAEFVRVLTPLLTDKALRLQIGSAGRTLIDNRFKWTDTTSRMLSSMQ